MGLVDYIFPRRCLGCGRVGQYFCADCRKSVQSVAPNESICPVCERSAMAGITHPRCRTKFSPDGLTSFFHYDGTVREAVKVLKYRFVSDLAREFVALVDSSAFDGIPLSDSLVPIALHSSRLRYRGFNQAEVLGRFVSEKLHIPIAVDILRRTRGTPPQAEIANRRQRLQNVEDIFTAHESVVRGRNILLFDDVFTTGATIRSACKTLKRVGAGSVWAITMAR